MLKKVVCIILTLLFAVGICACDSKNYPVTVSGVQIKKQPQKIVCLTVSIEDVVKTFAGEANIVGVCDYSVIKNGAVRVGSEESPNINAINSAYCDVCVCNNKLSKKDEKKLKKLGITLIVIPEPKNYEDLEQYYTDIGNLIMGQNNSKKKIKEAIKITKSDNTDKNTSAVLIPEKDKLAGKDTVFGTLVSCAGFNNVIKGTGFDFSEKKIIKADPDVIFCNIGMYNYIAQNENLKDVSAVKNKRIYEIDVYNMNLPCTGYKAVIKEMQKYYD